MPVTRIPLGLPRLDADALVELAARLTPRDYDILSCLHQHRVLTTHQIQKIFFTLPQPTRRRLAILHRLHTVTRFRPWTAYGGGSAPAHWILGRAGAALLAAKEGVTVSQLGYHPDVAMVVSVSKKLGHQIGVNDFFADLHHHARRSEGSAEVRAWWPERRCAQLWGDLARPDAYGRWTENGREIDFFLEHDTGSEPLARVTAKLNGYADLAEATRITTPVLLWLPGRARESHLRELIGETDVPVATAVHTGVGDGPAGPVWLPVGSSGPRLRLAELADAWPDLILGAASEPAGDDGR
ncbi:replication-relaxation family protein [Planomonospora sp. ID91781]|uniref:replication-relaxation family protein n=1 Tax=Planomonospora sp. ID91781 TaxID=2738135 RepID=UPI0018C3B097|nr:replication-relaxation family protein [Planomonospora sp. ID91781]MBG0824894.1 replication-relaxation family protein [Planomonospora sp. ID91781]